MSQKKGQEESGGVGFVGKIILVLILVFIILSIAFPGFRNGVRGIYQALASLVGIKFEMPGSPDGGTGSGSGSSCSVDVSRCQLSPLHPPSMPAEEVANWLRRVSSPAYRDEPDIGDFIYSESVRTGIDDAFAMAFFQHESSFGNTGTAAARKSIGNIRYTPVCTNEYGGRDYEGFCMYPTWKASVTHWYNLIKDGYVDQGQDTLGEIIAKYAPCSENNVNSYMASVRDFVTHYRTDEAGSCPV